MLKKFIVALAISSSMVLAGCSSEKKLDGTNLDALKSSWQEMYSEVPESERDKFVEGSGLMVLNSMDELYSSLDRMTTWSSLAYMDLTTNIMHRGDYRSEFNIAVTQGLNDKTKANIIDFADNSEIEVDDRTIDRAVDDFLR